MLLHTPRVHLCDMTRSHTVVRPSPRPSPELSHLAKLCPHLTPSPSWECMVKNVTLDVPGGPVVENPPASAGDTGSVPGLGRSHVRLSSEARGPRLLSPTLGPVLSNWGAHAQQ